jgi:hypothetical protein
MSNPSRRIVLAAAGTGAAAAAALASAPGASAANHASPDAAEPAGEPLVAHIEDVASGRLSILFGEEEVVVQDADLVRRLTRAARGG